MSKFIKRWLCLFGAQPVKAPLVVPVVPKAPVHQAPRPVRSPKPIERDYQNYHPSRKDDRHDGVKSTFDGSNTADYDVVNAMNLVALSAALDTPSTSSSDSSCSYDSSSSPSCSVD